MKYKVGDRVKVRKDLEVGQVYGDCDFIEEMKEFRGKIMTVEKVYYSSYYLHGGGTWHWSEEMLEDVESINILVRGNKVIAKKGDKIGIAKCSPKDEFDFFIGAKLALDRLEKECKPYAWLTLGEKYYYPSLNKDEMYDYAIYNNCFYDEILIKHGVVFKTKEEAVTVAKKMLEVVK